MFGPPSSETSAKPRASLLCRCLVRRRAGRTGSLAVLLGGDGTSGRCRTRKPSLGFSGLAVGVVPGRCLVHSGVLYSSAQLCNPLDQPTEAESPFRLPSESFLP